MKRYRLHKLFLIVLRNMASLVLRPLFGYRYRREAGPDVPSIIIANHNTDVDPALVGMGFFGHMYFLASEHAFRKGLFSKFLIFVFAPISFNKVLADTASLKEMLNRIKAGHSVCLFAEGNRSCNGVTGHIPASTAKLVKMSGAALITYRFEGGYFTTPRWAKKRRKGRMAGSVVGRYSAEELKALTAEEVLSIIRRDIHEDAYLRQKENPVPFRGADLAEFIEAVLYLCPACKKIGTIRSHGSRFFCACGLDARYTETCFLEGENLPFSTITEWDRWQFEHLTLMVNNSKDEPICADDNQKLFVINAGNASSGGSRSFVGAGRMQISRTEFQCAGIALPLQKITRFAMVDKMTLTFALKDGTMYEICSDFPRSALKYLEIVRIVRNEIE